MFKMYFLFIFFSAIFHILLTIERPHLRRLTFCFGHFDLLEGENVDNEDNDDFSSLLSKFVESSHCLERLDVFVMVIFTSNL